MLTYRRAIFVALGLITIFLLIRSQQQPSKPSIHDHQFKSAEQLPRPTLHLPTGGSASSTPTSAPSSSNDYASSSSDRRPRPQIPLSELSGKPLRSQLALRFPYDVTAKFPAYIWQTWKVSPASGDFPEEFRDFEISWTVQHPGFVHEVITDDAAIHILRHLYSGIPSVVTAYESLPLPVLKADFFRYLILLARGGIYTDIDTTALKPAFQWVPDSVDRASYGLIIGIEADPDREDWADWYARRIQFCQWTIQSKPGHPILREIVANITEEVLARKAAGTLVRQRTEKDDGVMELTGPGIWTDKIFEYFNDAEYFDIEKSKVEGGNITWQHFTGMTAAKKVGDVVVLPITSFSPGVQQMGAEEPDHPMAFVHHQFEGEFEEPLRMFLLNLQLTMV